MVPKHRIRDFDHLLDKSIWSCSKTTKHYYYYYYYYIIIIYIKQKLISLRREWQVPSGESMASTLALLQIEKLTNCALYSKQDSYSP
jgi:hypothetical protein